MIIIIIIISRTLSVICNMYSRPFATGYKSLLGSNDQSLGWDITHNKAIYNSCVINDYPQDAPDGFTAPDTVLVILDMNEGTLKFKDPKTDKNFGMCVSGLNLFPRKGMDLYPAISATKDGSVVKICYIGASGKYCTPSIFRGNLISHI